MDVLARVVQCLAGQRHPVLPADESTNTTRWSVNRPHSVSVAIAPDHSLRIRRNQLAVMIEQLAIRTDSEQRVIERSATGTSANSFADANHERHTLPAGAVPQELAAFTSDIDARGRVTCKDRLHRLVIPERHVAADVEPRRIPWQPRLGKYDE